MGGHDHRPAIAIGAIGQVSTWILGPVRGLFATAKEGTLPPLLQKKNKNDLPVNMLILQGVLVTFWGAVYVLAPGGVNSSFWMLVALTTTVYIVMYFLMYAAAIRLRYTRPDVPRSFKIPGGKAGMWLVGGFGFLMMILLLIVAMLPPSQISEGAGMKVPKITEIELILVYALSSLSSGRSDPTR